MQTSTAQEVASILLRDLGIGPAIAYAEKIERNRGPLSAQYGDAAAILRTWKSGVFDCCGLCGAETGLDDDACISCGAIRTRKT